MDPLLPSPTVHSAELAAAAATPSTPQRVRPIKRTEESPTTARIRELIPDTITPEKQYPIARNAQGKLEVQLTPSVKGANNLIYMFRQKSTGKVLIGLTEKTMKKRMSGYNTAFRNEKSQKGRLPLPTAVRDNPDDFECGVLYRSNGEVPLGKLENYFIDLKDSIHNGFNQRKGGGGGRAQKPVDPEKTKEIVKGLFADFSSPIKTPLKKTPKKVVAPLPPEELNAKAVVYVFCNTVTKERYVGTTCRELRKRLSEHLHYAAHPEKDAGKAPLYEAIRQDAENIGVGILYQAPEGDEAYCYEVEKAFIEHYESNKTGYNQNGGGGGGGTA